MELKKPTTGEVSMKVRRSSSSESLSYQTGDHEVTAAVPGPVDRLALFDLPAALTLVRSKEQMVEGAVDVTPCGPPPQESTVGVVTRLFYE